MGKELDLTQHVPLRKSAYSTVKMALRLRWHVPKGYKAIFDMEGDATWWDASLELKAKRVGVPIDQYQAALDFFTRRPVIRLAISLLRVENDFLDNWWVNMKKAEELAKSQIEVNPLQSAKMLLMVEREKMMGIKRLVETGRMIDPSEYVTARKKNKPKPVKPLVDERGVVDIEKIP